MIARRCSLCPASRSGSPGLSRILPGLALGSVTRPERTFEVFRSTSPTHPHRCEPAVDPLFGSPSELPSAARTGSRRSPLVGLDEDGGSPLPPLPVAPPSTVLSDASLEVTARVHSRTRTFALLLRPRDATPEVPFRPRGFAPPRRLSPRTTRGLVASRCRPWGSSRFLPGRNRAFPATLPPLEERHRPAVGTPVTRRLGPLDVPPLARLSPSRLFPSNRFRDTDARCRTAMPCSSWASISSPRFREIVFPLVLSSPRAGRGTHPPSLAGKQAS